MRRSNYKVAFRYFGPYKITRCINHVAYEVGLPPESKIHPVFHVSQLRKVLKPGMSSSTKLPIPTDEVLAPIKILDGREQIQVQWPPGSDQDVSWEDQIQLQQQFPDAMAWGQAMSQAGGDVSSSTNQGDATMDMGLQSKRARPRRLVQPNRKHVGPERTQ